MRWQQEGLPTVHPIAPPTKKQKKRERKQATLDAGELPSVTEHALFVLVECSAILLTWLFQV